ncbi:precorrin-8X methylmutase [Corynebacterium vitaeruminis]|uniref:Precorrin-8X methylmutase n=1 Tax=Corynebacterium vitaeruminis DSM 20294 TaxID=1224164 RepID=W5Y1G2_9CORY|nr:precorrin-8X methylmutase [Corynebacterium vitaeruminis]AHI22779.1 precorrin-8X methylmutase [Corynebacterium vitaeruminis DSM 20294]
MSFDYITDGNEIYRRSFAMIREESNLSAFDADQAQVAVRMIHAAGQTDLAQDIEMSAGAVTAAREALRRGAPILCDVNMVASGVTRTRLPKDNEVVCLLKDPRVPELAKKLGTTRTAAAVELWEDRLDGAVVAIGNAPTALFHLLNWLEEDPTRPRPAVILGIPVGFVGAAESKQACADVAEKLGTEFITVHGRRGGSAITCAAINALATEKEIL